MNNKMKEILNKISETAEILYRNGWSEANAGNISVNVSDAQDSNISILVTSSGSRMRQIALSPEKYCGIVTIDNSGDIKRVSGFNNENFNPTSELSSHINIHRYLVEHNRKEKAVIHTHPDEIIALMQFNDMNSVENINNLMRSIHSEFNLLLPDGVEYLPFFEPGSKDLADNTLKKLENSNIILWKDHGCISIGNDLDSAMDNIEIVNKISRIILLQK